MFKAIPLGGLGLFVGVRGRVEAGRRRVSLTHFLLRFAERIFTPFPSHFLYSAPFVVAWIWQCFDVLNSSC